VWLHSLLILASDLGEWSASHRGRFTIGEKSPWHPLVRRPVGHWSRAGHCIVDRNILLLR